ncbi:MAG: hypothetical protein BWK80_21055 [Desulfobacteraceae bacterium IS3]|nr:MAG: hypothetical protein BWK80_21055 [Desulfobacteraceae bacterium IS3]
MAGYLYLPQRRRDRKDEKKRGKKKMSEEANVTVLGDFVDPKETDFEGSLTFTIKAAYIEKEKLWKSKDLTAEFLGNFWKNILDIEEIKPTLHFVCAELLENAVYHSLKSDYLIMIHLCFKTDELLVYVRNSAETEKIEAFKEFVRSILEAENLQKLFVQSMKNAKKSGGKRSQVGLITILKDRGAKLSWKIEQETDMTLVTTLSRISLKGKDE